MFIAEANSRPWIPEFTPIGQPAEIIYQRDKPNNPLFEYFRTSDQQTIVVGQGEGKISTGDKKLLSIGFTGCSGLILRESEENSAALFHMVGNRLSTQQRLTIIELAQKGPLDALLLQGNWSWPVTINGGELFRFNFSERRQRYQHQNDGGRFDIMYDPNERTARFFARGQEFQPKGGPHIAKISF
jgi:hypothetical protein